MAQTLTGARAASRGQSSRARSRILRLVLVVAIVVFLGIKIWRVTLLLRDLSSRAGGLAPPETAALDLASAGDIATQLGGLADDIHNLRAELGPLVYLGPLGSWVPQYGPDAAQAPALFTYGEELASGASHAASLFGAISSEIEAGRTPGQPLGRTALPVLQRHASDIQVARAELDRVLAARRAVQPSTLSPRARALFDRVDQLIPLWSAGLNAFQIAPELLGANGTRVYLLIMQNSDELRPTGGFISSIVRVRVENGDISTLDFSDSYAIDNPDVTHPDPPIPLQRYMDAGIWVVRDANWSPDFPTSASDVERLYQLDRGVASDGMIAVDLNLVPRLLEAIGPVAVEGYSETVDSTNAIAKLQQYWASPQGQGQTGDWWLHRKDFGGQLLVTMLERLRAGEFDRAKFARLLFEAMAAKNLMLYSNDPTTEAQLQTAGWGGQVDTGTGDRLMIVDSNLGFNKVDPSVERTVDYSVVLDPSGTAKQKLTLRYANLSPDTGSMCVHAAYYPPTYAEMEQGCYWDYFRVVAAPEAQLLSTTDGLDAGAEDPVRSRSVFHGYFVLPRGSSREVELDYKSPDLISDGKTFHLALEIQPGAPARPIHISVKLPDDWADWTSSIAPQKVTEHLVEFNMTLDHNQEIVIERKQGAPAAMAFGIGLAGVSLVSGGLWWLGRSRRRTRPGQPIQS